MYAVYHKCSQISYIVTKGTHSLDQKQCGSRSAGYIKSQLMLVTVKYLGKKGCMHGTRMKWDFLSNFFMIGYKRKARV